MITMYSQCEMLEIGEIGTRYSMNHFFLPGYFSSHTFISLIAYRRWKASGNWMETLRKAPRCGKGVYREFSSQFVSRTALKESFILYVLYLENGFHLEKVMKIFFKWKIAWCGHSIGEWVHIVAINVFYLNWCLQHNWVLSKSSFTGCTGKK